MVMWKDTKTSSMLNIAVNERGNLQAAAVSFFIIREASVVTVELLKPSFLAPAHLYLNNVHSFPL